MNRFGFLLVALFVLPSVSAGATQQGQSVLRSWKIMDACTRQAQTAYPEFNADSNAKRDARLKACLNSNGLPPRESLGQPAPR